MKITFEGDTPFRAPKVQSASAQFSGETVEMILFLLDDHQQMGSLRFPMTIGTARNLGLTLSRVALEADQSNGRG